LRGLDPAEEPVISPLRKGAGRLTVDAIATRLGVTIVPAG